MADSFLASNFAALQQHVPDAEELILQATDSGRTVEIFDSGSAGLNLDLFTSGKEYIHYHRQELPANEIADQLAPGWERELDLLVIIGAGICHHLIPLMASRARAGILVVEPEPLALAAAMQHVDLSLFLQNPRVAFLLGTDTDRLAEALGVTFETLFLPRCKITALAGMKEIHAPFIETAGVVLSEQMERATLRVRSHRVQGAVPLENIVINFLRGLEHDRVLDLEGAARGRPAVVIGSGPSLDKNGYMLRAASEKAVIIASASVLPFLRELGVVPDAAILADPNRLNRAHFENPLPPEALLVYDAAADPESVVAGGGRPTIANCGHTLTTYLESLTAPAGNLLSWGSVSTSCVDFALKLGCDPVVLVGQDFAFTEFQRHYIGYRMPPDLPGDIVGPRPDFVQELDIFGSPVSSLPPLLAYRDWLSRRLSPIKKPRVFNATEGGILTGLEQRSLRDLVGEWMHLPGKEPLGGALRVPDSAQLARRDFLRSFDNDFSVFCDAFRTAAPAEFPQPAASLPLYKALRGLAVDELIQLEEFARVAGIYEPSWQRQLESAIDRFAIFSKKFRKLVMQAMK